MKIVILDAQGGLHVSGDFVAQVGKGQVGHGGLRIQNGAIIGGAGHACSVGCVVRPAFCYTVGVRWSFVSNRSQVAGVHL